MIGSICLLIIYLFIFVKCLDCSRPWLCYWNLHALEILGERLTDEEYSPIVHFLSNCQHPDGGFGGGPGQYPHLASTYAAVCALSIIETEEAYDAINRLVKKKKNHLLRKNAKRISFKIRSSFQTGSL